MTTTRMLEQPPAVDRGNHYPHWRSLLAGELLLGLAAVVGTVQLVTGVSTPPDADLPRGLSSWALPGLWLFVMVAVPSLASAALVAHRNADAPAAVWCATALLVVELLVQIPFLGLSMLQVLCAGIGLSLAVLAARAHARGWRRL